MSDFEDRVQNVFREVFDRDDLAIYNEMQAKDVERVGLAHSHHVDHDDRGHLQDQVHDP